MATTTTKPYGHFDRAFLRLKRPTTKNNDVDKLKHQLSNLIDVDNGVLDTLIRNSSDSGKKLARHLVEDIAPLQFGYDEAASFALAAFRDGMGSESALAPDMDYVMQWLLLQATMIKVIRMMKLPKRAKDEMQTLWLDLLTRKAVTIMTPTMRMPSPRSLEGTNLAANVSEAKTTKRVGLRSKGKK